ncbi:hypothetical protein [Marivita sp. S2033]|uniref:hypothetical protein n=1 Tax=Marivita sp. S2033 TaxID=3373187 RepID=UPI0039823CDC
MFKFLVLIQFSFFLLFSVPLYGQTPAPEGRVSFGLNGISDWSTQVPFLDLMKTARPWVGHLPNQWGGQTFDELVALGVISDEGWPTLIPMGTAKIEALILTDQPEDSEHLAGVYTVVFDGSGEVEISGIGRLLNREEGVISFRYRPGPGSVGIAITRNDPKNPIRNIKVFKEEHSNLVKSGVQFNPYWLQRLGKLDKIRFMDWMDTNSSSAVSPKDMPSEDDFSFAWRGVPIETMVALANEIHADPWFTIPHMANDDYVRSFSSKVFENLDPRLIAHVEFSNEVWNFIFDQADWAQRKANAAWGDIGDGWMQYYGFRAASIMDIWTDVFGKASDSRLKRVVSVHTAWPELEKAVLYGDRATEALGDAPVAHFDAYAVTGYFGGELGNPHVTNRLLDEAEKSAEIEGKSRGLSRASLETFVDRNRFEAAFQPAADIVERGSLRTLLEDLWPYHAMAADEAGLDLIMYEGGTHAAPLGEAVSDDLLVEFLSEFNYSKEMAALYARAISAWEDLSGDTFNAFVDVAPPSKWGSWGALRHLSDQNPRWDALRSQQAVP